MLSRCIRPGPPRFARVRDIANRRPNPSHTDPARGLPIREIPGNIPATDAKEAMMRTLALLALLALAGCATIEGIGRDISAGARAVNDMM